MPYGVEEYGVAGALNGEAITVVPAETFDCMVPAEAEIVMEGIIRTDILEPEASFGEASGYLGPRKMEKVFEVTAITHRADPIYQGIISEFPPSESTVMQGRLRCDLSAASARCLQHTVGDQGRLPRNGELQHAICHPARPARARPALAGVAGGPRSMPRSARCSSRWILTSTPNPWMQCLRALS